MKEFVAGLIITLIAGTAITYAENQITPCISEKEVKKIES